jgi:hypothetical protein
VKRGFFGALLFVLLLAVYLWTLAPTVAILAPVFALTVYAIAVHNGVRAVLAVDPVILRVIGICGALSAAVFMPSILIEYTGRTLDNRIMLWAGAVSCGLAGTIAAWRTKRVRIAVCASTLSAMIGSLAFVIAVLGSYCLLRGSALQDRFFRTEGDYDDFAKSGMMDFNAWVTADLFGGVFFHLLLGALVAAALGLIAGTLVIGCLRLAERYSPRPKTNSA